MKRLEARALVLLVSFLIGALAAPAFAEVTRGDVEDARETLRQVRERLADEVAEYEAAVAAEAALLDTLDRLRVQLTARERELVLAAAWKRVAEMRMTASTGPVTGSSDDGSGLTRHVIWNRCRRLIAGRQPPREVARDFEQQQTLVEQAVSDQEAMRSRWSGW
jgi:GTPase